MPMTSFSTLDRLQRADDAGPTAPEDPGGLTARYEIGGRRLAEEASDRQGCPSPEIRP